MAGLLTAFKGKIQDYKINLKTEFEIQLWCVKIAYLINYNLKLLEIQELQTDYLQDFNEEIYRE